jgi:hypothetical protein
MAYCEMQHRQQTYRAQAWYHPAASHPELVVGVARRIPMRLPRMTTRRWMVAVSVVALILGTLVIILRWDLNPYITVMIFNETNAALSDVIVSYGDGQRRAERIEAGGIATSDIQSYGESGIILS